MARLTMSSTAYVSLALAALVGVSACSDWRKRVKPGLAETPTQTMVEAKPTKLRFGDTPVTITARAAYRTKAWVVAVDDGFDDGLEAAMPLDVSLAWGPLGSPDVLSEMSFHLARRYVSVRWGAGMPLANRDVMTHMSNHHMVPSTPELATYLANVRPGDLLMIEGFLVDVEIGTTGRKARTSLTRDDKGNGACEIVFVERAEITRL